MMMMLIIEKALTITTDDSGDDWVEITLVL